MTCQFLEPPEQTPCYSTATHKARVPLGARAARILPICADHALELRAAGIEVWPIEAQS